MTEHTLRQYDIELEEIRRRILNMGGLAEAQVVKAIEGLRSGQIDLVVARGEQLDEAEVAGLADDFARQGRRVQDEVVGVAEGGEDRLRRTAVGQDLDGEVDRGQAGEGFGNLRSLTVDEQNSGHAFPWG